jgi:hypothetical protein
MKNIIKTKITLVVSFILLSLTTQGNAAQQQMYYSSGFGVQPAWQNPKQNMGERQSKPGYVKHVWEPGTTLPVRTREGILTVINLPDWERIREAFIGDKAFFDGRPISKNSFVISPVDGRAGADTNLVLIGDSGNKYVFYLTSEPVSAKSITDNIVDIQVPHVYKSGVQIADGMSFSGTSGSGTGGISNFLKTSYSAVGDPDEPELNEDFGWIKSIPLDPTKLRFDMEIFVPNPDDYVIAPERVWRDDIYTYVDFGDKAINMPQRPVPAILIEGGEAPVGFRTDGPNGRLMIIEAVGDFVLRNGQRIVCIKKREKPFVVATEPDTLTTYENAVATPMISPAAGGAGNIPPIDVPQVGMMPMQGMPSQPGMPNQNIMMPGSQYQAPSVGTPGYNATLQQNPIPKQQLPRGAFLPDKNTSLVYSDKAGDIAVELGAAPNVKDLEYKLQNLREGLGKKFDEIFGNLEPFYTIEIEGVDELGQKPSRDKEIYRLRMGPIDTVEEGDAICTELMSYNIPCSIVRSQ